MPMNCCIWMQNVVAILIKRKKEIIIEIQLLLNENCEVYKKFKVIELGKYHLSNNCWTLELAKHQISWRNRERIIYVFASGFPEKKLLGFFDPKYCFLPEEAAKYQIYGWLQLCVSSQ